MDISQTPSPLRSPEQQLALQLFFETSPHNKSIGDAKTDVGFNISQPLIDVKDLSVLARKALIGCYFLAATSVRNEVNFYDFDLGFFKWLINYKNSNNIAHLKKVLKEAQKSLIEVNVIDDKDPNNDRWVSVHMVETVAIGGGRIAYRLPPELVSGLSNPNGIIMYLSMRIQANFSSIHAQTLFAKIEPLKHAGCTPWMLVPEFMVWMNIINKYQGENDFRYLKRDVIDLAVGQINEYSDVELKMETKTARGTRRIEFLRFTIIRKSSGEDSWTNALNGVVTEQQIYDVLKTEFAMAQKDIDEVSANRDKWSNAQILDAIEYTRLRMKDTKLEFLRKPGNYFLKALKDGYRVVTAPQKLAEKATVDFEKKRRATVQEDGKKATKAQSTDTAAIMSKFLTMDAAVQDELWGSYSRKGAPGSVIIKRVEKANNAGDPMQRDDLLDVEQIQRGFAAVVKRHLNKA